MRHGFYVYKSIDRSILSSTDIYNLYNEILGITLQIYDIYIVGYTNAVLIRQYCAIFFLNSKNIHKYKNKASKNHIERVVTFETTYKLNLHFQRNCSFSSRRAFPKTLVLVTYLLIRLNEK